MAAAKAKTVAPKPVAKAETKPPIAAPVKAPVAAAPVKAPVAAAPVAKPVAAPAAAAKSGAKHAVTAEVRARMIADAAYYIAEKRGFGHGHHDADWAAAEKQIDALLSK